MNHERAGDRIVFLDIDGVLNSIEYGRHHQVRGGVPTLDSAAVARLNRITSASGAKIVVSSNWRNLLLPARLRDELRSAGVEARIIGRTPNLPHAGRAAEIWDYIAFDPRPVESFVALDDDPWLEALKDRLVLTDWRYGLLDRHVDDAIAILQIPLAGHEEDRNEASRV